MGKRLTNGKKASVWERKSTTLNKVGNCLSHIF